MVASFFEILRTSYNTDLIFYKNYFYTQHHVGKLFISWRCQKRDCPARIRSTPLDKMEIIDSTDNHNHVLSENDISKKFLSSKIQNIAKNTAYTTQQVYSVSTSSEKLSDLPIVNKKHICKNIRNIRKRSSIIIDKTRNLDELKVNTLRNETFCIYDSGVGANDRIVIFATENNLSHLKNSRIMIADGTFKVCPKEFLQLYVIHGEVCSKIYALVYILLKTKKEGDYLRALNIINEKCQFQLPNYVVIDFEFAAFNAFKKLSNSQNFFCLFHFGQCIWRKLQKLGLSKDFLQNKDFRLFIKSVTSLAFVPVDFVEKEYTKVIKKSLCFSEIDLTVFF